ncbi:MAG: NAD-dependent epimerase/dehydratase family protein [Alphaproteobacteria bacterium]|nr:NAD-dependent epimerase/dehydratase family protein [Alphaproteobacteria bacterium]
MTDPTLHRVIVIGGAGFIGSHVVDRLLADPSTEQVTVYDNFTSGRDWHLAHHAGDTRLSVARADVKDLDALTGAMAGHGLVVHLASNPDIAAAMTDPAIDFHEGTALTHNVVEAMRMSGAARILYASGSGLYGDLGATKVPEDHAPMEPISTYGASKMAGEALISSYVHMFGITGCVFRFANVVGPRQTHGVGYDFVRRLMADGSRLTILGDGQQTKSYIHVTDVIDAVMTAHARETAPFRAFNVATEDAITVIEIGRLACAVVGLDPDAVRFDFTGGDRGWKGDVPVVRFNTEKIHSLGWRCQRNSREAMQAALEAMAEELQ